MSYATTLEEVLALRSENAALKDQLDKCRVALAAQQMAYEALHGRVGYVQFRELEAKADELRKAILSDEIHTGEKT